MDEKAVIDKALANIFKSIDDLKKAFPQKAFTINGRLFGDLGEVIATLYYYVELYPVQKPVHDGKSSDGRKVQIKATFKNSPTFKTKPDYYLGLKLSKDGGPPEEIYNGLGRTIYQHYKDRNRKGIGEISLSFPIVELKKLSALVSPTDRIKKR